jgi:pimeloyl-ACP methyl ester carboxylesterase
MKLFSKIMGEGSPILILHGVFGSGDNWGTLGRKWSSDYEVHLVDARNHGHSPHSETFSYDVMADDLLAYMEEHQLEQAHILGHSMGGKVAMLFAVYHPEKVKSLIVADIAPRAYAPHHQEIIHALQDLDLENLDSRSAAEDAFTITEPGTRQFLLKSLYWKEKGKLAWRFNVPVIAREIEKVGEALPPQAIYYGPTLFIRGGKSNYVRDEDLEQIALHFPEVSCITLENAGHWLHAEKPDAFYAEVSKFLNG